MVYIEQISKRIADQRGWLTERHPEVFEEQKHLDAGSPERAYWHYGYAVALSDVLRKIKG